MTTRKGIKKITFYLNIFHTKMILKDFDLDTYLFGTAKKELSVGDKRKIKQRLKKEMSEIFSKS